MRGRLICLCLLIAATAFVACTVLLEVRRSPTSRQLSDKPNEPAGQADRSRELQAIVRVSPDKPGRSTGVVVTGAVIDSQTGRPVQDAAGSLRDDGRGRWTLHADAGARAAPG